MTPPEGEGVRPESSVPGWAAAGLRWLAVFLVLALLWNPGIPGSDPAHSARGFPSSWVLLDLHPSLAVDGADGGQLLDVAVARLQELHADGWAVAVSRDGSPESVPDPSGTPLEAWLSQGPSESGGATALRRLVEAGADSVIFLSTLRSDADELARVLEEGGSWLEVEQVGAAVRNAGLARFDVPERALPGEPFLATLALVSEDGEEEMPPDSLDVTVTLAGEVVETRRVPRPEAGVWERLEVELTLPPEVGAGSRVTFSARVDLEGDRFAPDDERVREVMVGRGARGIVLVSVQPDWEPRALLPVLERATGLEGMGVLRLARPEGGVRWISLGGPGGGGGTALDLDLARAVEDARLVVLHGVGTTGTAAGALPRTGPEPVLEAGSPLASALADHPRVLHLPTGVEGLAAPGLEAWSLGPGSVRSGRWGVDRDLPPSPIRGALAGVDLAGLPPLEGGVEAAGGGETGTEVAFRIRRPGEPEARPALLLLDAEDRRRVVALSRGFHGWASRDGAPRAAYRDLWAGVAGWLLALEVEADRNGETDRVVAPGSGADGMGIAGMRAVGLADPRDDPRADALLSLPADASALNERAAAALEASTPSSAESRRSLRSHPAPWLILLGCLLAAWTLRRRAGLP